MEEFRKEADNFKAMGKEDDMSSYILCLRGMVSALGKTREVKVKSIKL